MLTKLFIGGLVAEFDEMDLAQLVAPYGDVATIKIVKDNATRKSKGYAFVEVVNKEAADYAIDTLDCKIVNGKELTLNIVQEEAPKSETIYKKVEKASSNGKKKRPRISKT